MASVLHFSPAFKPALSLGGFSSAPSKSSKKRKRSLEPLDKDGERSNLDLNANGTSLTSSNSNAYITTPSTAPNVATSHVIGTFQFQNSSQADYGILDHHLFPQSFPHRIVETAHLVSKGQVSDELATLHSPLYVATARLPNTTAEKIFGSTGLRQHHLKIVTAILHRCLSEGDYIHAGRAWAILLRAEQSGHSMNLVTHDRWGVGAEILLERESQNVQKLFAQNAFDIQNSMADPSVKAERMEKAKEYYEWVVLEYPYRKEFPNATVSLNFSIAMFGLWIYTVKEQNSMALMAFGSFAEAVDETDSEANDSVERSSALGTKSDRHRKCEQIRKDTLQSALEIGGRLDGLLVSPPYSDDARFWKLCGETSLWIADLSTASIFSNSSSGINEGDEDQTMGSPSLLREISGSASSNQEHRLSQGRQKALARANTAFERARICNERVFRQQYS